MTKQSKKFGELLTLAVRTVANREYKTLASLQDELGYALGRGTGGSAIDYWRRGFVPAYLNDLEQLTRELVRRNGLNRDECEQLLVYGDHPYPEKLLVELFPAQTEAQPIAEPIRSGQHAARAYDWELSHFVVGPPITRPRQFFGRERELNRIFRAWQRFPLEHFTIVGLRRSGKTSLLYNLKNITGAAPEELRAGQRTDYLLQPDQFQWVLVDFQDPRHRSQERLLRYLLVELNIPVPEPCNQATFLDVMSQHLQTPAVILMDEISAGLGSTELDEDFWWCLRALASHYTGGNLAFVLTSPEAPTKLAQDQGKPSPFFNIFHLLELGPLTENEARELIASSPKTFDATDVEWILAQSGGWPCLLQILCQACLIATEEEVTGQAWREEAIRQMEPFAYLLKAG